MSEATPAYLDPYKKSLQEHGVEFDVTLWASPHSQARRFQIFTQMVDFTGVRIMDAGCSRGDFAQWLVQAKIEYGQFTGVDGLAEVIEFARSRGFPRSDFFQGDFLKDPSLLARGKPDVVCISGSLNTMQDDQAMAVLEGAWKAAGSVLAFNFLSNTCGVEAPRQDTFSRRLDTMKLLGWAFKKSSSVQFRQDYFRAGHDATIVIRKT